MPSIEVTSKIPSPGRVARVRTRTYLVESVEENTGSGTLTRMSCLDDDAQGQPLEVIWELELDAEILDSEAWASIGKRGFDEARQFSAYIHTLRWNCVTATDPKIFQAPFRAGIRLDAYQLEPLRKALLLPRVNLFIADDVGLGKTIEAGLIASELLLRRRVREIVVSCPPSMLTQWKEELESRFGLTFEILDRQYIDRVREERGYGVNPWTTFPRFLISHKLLIDETYTTPMRDWLGSLKARSLFILDEAHHAAPSGGSKYAIDSRITRAVRELAPRFEHRLFLSATPHNGHSNSFSSLLELLDPQRFTRGVKVTKGSLESVMVRRLKEDLRRLVGGFAERKPVQIDIAGLPADAPELRLSKLLDEYRKVRTLRFRDASKRKQAEATLLISHLQQRLLSSIEAFARTLSVHRRTMEKHWAIAATTPEPPPVSLFDSLTDSDDDRSQLAEEEQEALASQEMEQATQATVGDATLANIARERELLTEMENIANQFRSQPDARVRYLIDWVRENMCPGNKWNDLRLLIFTEYDDTRRYLVNTLRYAIEETDLAEFRIEVFHGPTPPEKRDAIKRAFNLPPHQHPVRILVATDAAREGINLQAHCHNLFHFDVPWNPSRLEQRNGRIDRKLQPAPVVYCHYFVYIQRPEDRVLRALVRKTETIRRELGSLAAVLEERLANTIRNGIRHEEVEHISAQIDEAALDVKKRATVEEELESSRESIKLKEQIEVLRNRLADASKWIRFDEEQLKDALSCSLELLGSEPLQPAATPHKSPSRFVFPNLDVRHGADPTWSTTLDTLRAAPDHGPRNYQWRKEKPIRPVVFKAAENIDDDIVQLHLSHRVVQRLLGRFLSQGFVHHDLSRACLAQSSDAIPRVVLLGRLSLYGAGAARLHEELLSVTARWIEPSLRKGPLAPYAREAENRTLDLLEDSLKPGVGTVSDLVGKRLQSSFTQDIQDLLPQLEKRGEEAKADAEEKLITRGSVEAEAMRRVLEEQKKRVIHERSRHDEDQLLLDLDSEKRQLEANRRYWDKWLENADADLQQEPERLRKFYEVVSYRIEPVGLAYLWPVTG